MKRMQESLTDGTEAAMQRNQQIFKKILVAINITGYYEKLIAYGVRLAKVLGSDIAAIHVIEESPKTPTVDVMQYYSEGKAYEEDYEKDIKKRAEKILEQAQLFASKEGIAFQTEILATSTSVSESIIEFAKANNIELILIGTKDMTGVVKFLLGSVANKVITHAPCPVLAIR